MNERYTKLFALPENTYLEGAPVIVSAGNLLKDNHSGGILVQLKIKNITNKTIKAATVSVKAFDTTGNPIEGDAEQQYLDLFVQQGEEFGQKTPICLSNSSTRGFAVSVKQIIFSDNSIWNTKQGIWEPLPVPETLNDALQDKELVKQFQLKFGGKCSVMPQEGKGLWRCTCGEWNIQNRCFCCGKEKTPQLLIDLEDLKANRDERLAKEDSARRAKQKKAKLACAFGIPLSVALIVLFVFLNNVRIKHGHEQEQKAEEQRLEQIRAAEEKEAEIVQSAIVGTFRWLSFTTQDNMVSEREMFYTFSEDGTFTSGVKVKDTFTFVTEGKKDSYVRETASTPSSGNYSINVQKDAIVLSFTDGKTTSIQYVLSADNTISLVSGVGEYYKVG